MLPVTVLIPTRNAMSLLPRHLETMRPWLDLIPEFIVVDSESRDGTLERLRAELPADRTRFFQHRPGLYQSWNHGVRQAQFPFLYVSTVGDGITPDGLVHLVDVAERLAADVVVSPPLIVDERQQPIGSNPWPVHHLISLLGLEHPVCLEGLAAFVCALSFIPFAILGSSASNLYRTTVLQKRPFPTDYGSNGDGAWGVFNALDIRFTITPRQFSFFRQHERTYPRIVEDHADPEYQMMVTGWERFEQAMACRPELQAEAARHGIENLVQAKQAAQLWRSALIRHRERRWPWVLNPAAWWARLHRNRAQRYCDAVLASILARAIRPATSDEPSWQPVQQHELEPLA